MKYLVNTVLIIDVSNIIAEKVLYLFFLTSFCAVLTRKTTLSRVSRIILSVITISVLFELTRDLSLRLIFWRHLPVFHFWENLQRLGPFPSFFEWFFKPWFFLLELLYTFLYPKYFLGRKYSETTMYRPFVVLF